jgi:hypothetical protein
MKRSLLTLMVLSLLLSGLFLIGFNSGPSAQPFGGHRGGGPGGGIFSNLTDEQRQAIHELMDQMRAEGAGPEEIHTAISELFAEWGLEMPAPPEGPDGRWGGHDGREGRREGLEDELSEEQRATLHSTMLQMWQDGAAGKEIHETVAGLLEGWGFEPPEDMDSGRGPGGGQPPFQGPMVQLNEEQRKEIRQLIGELRQQGASQDEIRTAVEGKLTEWGIDLPKPPPELTLEQRQALHAVIFELWQGGATHEEIRSAAAQQFESFGLQVPERGPGPRGHGPWPGIQDCLKPPLTQEQRESLHEAIRELRSQGASPDEIHQAMRALLSDLGVEIPDLDADLSAEQRTTLRATVLKLWLNGTTRTDICQEVTNLLEGFGLDLPEKSGELNSQEEPAVVPIRAQNYPNPANPKTQIDYTLGVSENVSMRIYNISGQLVRSYDIGYQRPGSYSITWDGRRQNGQAVASGIYFYRIQAGPHAITNRIVLLK